MIDWAKKVNPDLNFIAGTEIDGLPNYLAVDKYKTIVQIVGSEYEVKSAKWTYTFNPNVALNKKLLMDVAYFVYIFEPKKMPEWINSEMEIIAKDLNQEYTSKKQRIGFNKMAQIIYSPKLKIMSVLVSTQE